MKKKPDNSKPTNEDYVDPILFEDGFFNNREDYDKNMKELLGSDSIDNSKLKSTNAGRKKLKRAGLLNK